MAIRVDSNAAITFGVMSAQVVVSHVRFRRGSDDAGEVVYELPSAITVPADQGLRIPSGMFDLVYKAGPFGNTHMQSLVEAWWGATGSRTSIEVDAMTSSSAVVSDSGYSQQSFDGWLITTEAD